MSQKLEVSILDTSTGRRSSATCMLPAEIGRLKKSNEHSIELDAPSGNISRKHATIELVGSTLQFRDHSSNGSVVDGRVVHNTTARLAADSTVQIGSYRLTAALLAPLTIRETTASLTRIDGCIMPDSAEVAVLAENGGLRLESMSKVPESAGQSVVLVMRQAGGSISCRKGPAAAGRPIDVDKKRVEGDVFEVGPLSVLEISSVRFEVHHPHRSSIVCGNPACHLLNPPGFEQNCCWCGVHLAASGAMSRPIAKTEPSTTKP